MNSRHDGDMTILLVKGDDETLVAQAVQKAVSEMVGDGDRSLMLEELSEANYLDEDGTPDITPVINAAHTLPFLTDKRVVVARNLALFSKGEQVAPLVGVIADPVSTTDLVLVWERGSGSGARMAAIPKKLKDALKSAGVEQIEAAPSGKGRRTLLESRLAQASVIFDQSAKVLIADRLGDDVGRVNSVLDALHSAFGAGAKLTGNDVEPFLGEASDVPPWELTDAIDSANIATAIEKLHRMTQGGGRHALQIMATLTTHYQRALRLDGSGASDEKAAAAHLGMSGSTFPARKSLTVSNRLGSARLAKVIDLLAQADLDIRGASAIPSEVVMEVLVARLARLSRA